MEDCNKASENAYENLNNQTGSGVFTREDNWVMNVVTPWQIAHQKEKEKKQSTWRIYIQRTGWERKSAHMYGWENDKQD